MKQPPRQILVMGAGGRIGKILRTCWPQGLALWQIRQPSCQPDWITVSPLAEPEALAAAAQQRQVDTILCLAGVTRPIRHKEMRDNVDLALVAVRAGAVARARVVLCSSSAVYGKTPGLLSETTPVAPITDYGAAKAQMEIEALTLAAELNVPTCCLRIGNVAGADAALGGWTPACQMDQYPDGATPARSYIGPQTLARVMRDMCARSDLPDVLNVAAPGLIQMGDLLTAAGRAWAPRPAPESALREVELDVTRLTRLIPIAPATPEALAQDCQNLEGALA